MNLMNLTDSELRLVSQLAQRQLDLEEELENAELEVKRVKAELDQVRTVDLPNALAELGVESWTLTGGYKITCKPRYYASIPKDNKEAAFTWLKEHDLDSVIKNVVSTEFGKGEYALATQAVQELISLGFRPRQEMSVHPMTLKSLVKDLLERGVEFPLDLFGAGVVQETVITAPKNK